MTADKTGVPTTPQTEEKLSVPRGPNYWFRHIGREEFPVFRQSVLSVARVLSQVKSSSTEMAKAVAMDPLLTVRVLRTANSAFYSAGIQKISTVQRAVVVVGYDALRHLCAALRFVEECFSGIRLKSIQSHVRLSYHQALLAQWFAETIRDGAPEEVYCAGLLADIGLIHLLGVLPVSSIVALHKNLERHGLASQEEVEQKVLGFAARTVTAKMAADWKLGDLLEKVARKRDTGNLRVKCVCLARDLTRALAEDAEGKGVLAVRERVGDELKISQMNMRRMMDAAAQWTHRWGQAYGLDGEDLVMFGEEGVRTVDAEHAQAMTSPGASPEESPRPAAVARKPDATRQLEIMDAIHALLMDASRRNSRALWDLVAQGLRQGAGLDRVALMRVVSGGRFLEVKELYGDFDPGLKGLMVPLATYRNLFAYCLERPDPIWVHDGSPEEIKSLVGPEVMQFFGSRDFVLGRIMGREGPVGLIGADCHETGRSLDEESMQGFLRLWRCASVAMEQLGI
ncbi:HDOD domain-containing protein [Desulfacinum hydrothermale DSM 13146]|uniref:HDOD domain-containing protein n=1 Tax=Desulfacinum hydrothermale DSM 13146 TaxID=1121390 RepID=A0A1W1XT15_9BACT|nr:HDOD domain-containing protein [Desulfacinum hydrothermale]SMC27027.1 HDOD domain-containing protein [Desulfacinum hydrothermale DSM 13146]